MPTSCEWMVCTLPARTVVVTRNADGAADIAHQVRQAGAVGAELRRQRGERHQIHRHEHQAHADALHERDEDQRADADMRASSPSCPTSTRAAARRRRSSAGADRSSWSGGRRTSWRTSCRRRAAPSEGRSAVTRVARQDSADRATAAPSSPAGPAPITNIRTSAETKLRSLKISGGMNGFLRGQHVHEEEIDADARDHRLDDDFGRGEPVLGRCRGPASAAAPPARPTGAPKPNQSNLQASGPRRVLEEDQQMPATAAMPNGTLM